jgi:hypothetical protein
MIAQENYDEILCSGITNDEALIEIQLDLFSKQNRISIEGKTHNLSVNNDFTIAWSNEVDGISYNNFISKINGSMVVIAVNSENNSDTTIRANLSCVKKEDRILN